MANVNTNAHRGRAIQILREERGLTKSAILNPKIIAYVENGGHNHSIETFDSISRAFGVETWEVLRFADRLRDTMDTRDEDSPRLNSPAWRAA